MKTVLIKAAGFILVIVLGYLLKERGIVKKEDSKMFSTIVMNVTLPCALLASASSIKIVEGMLIPVLLGLAVNLIMDLVGYIEARGKSVVDKGISMVQISGYNVGNFTLPFVQAFFPQSYVATVLLFDVGNAIPVLGGNYMIATALNHREEPMTFRMIVKNLFNSFPFAIYTLTFILSAFGIAIPAEVVELTKMPADANPFLAMLMLGMLVDIRLEKKDVKRLAKLVSIRVGMSILLAGLIYFLLPLPIEVRQMLMVCVCSPISVIASVYAMKLGAKNSEAANLNSLCILSSIVLMTLLLIWFSV